MKCPEFRRRLLKAEDPGRLPAEVRGHLAGCPRCRRLYGHLRQLELDVSELPVPPTSARAGFLEHFLAPPPPPVVTRPVVSAPRLSPWRYLTAAAAAVLFLAAAGLVMFAFRPGPDNVPHPVSASRPLLNSLLERDLRLARATTQSERVEALAELADDLHGETEFLAPEANAADLQALASLYGEVIREGIVPRARDLDLPAEERRQLLTRIADHLTEAARTADQRAEQVPASASALQAIAKAARDGDGRLRQMIQEERP
jgi:hypothetical protein